MAIFKLLALSLKPRNGYRILNLMALEGVNAAKILKAKKMFPYHYATFRLTEEPINEPLEWIKRLAKDTKELEIIVLKPGELEKDL